MHHVTYTLSNRLLLLCLHIWIYQGCGLTKHFIVCPCRHKGFIKSGLNEIIVLGTIQRKSHLIFNTSHIIQSTLLEPLNISRSASLSGSSRDRQSTVWKTELSKCAADKRAGAQTRSWHIYKNNATWSCQHWTGISKQCFLVESMLWLITAILGAEGGTVVFLH